MYLAFQALREIGGKKCVFSLKRCGNDVSKIGANFFHRYISIVIIPSVVVACSCNINKPTSKENVKGNMVRGANEQQEITRHVVKTWGLNSLNKRVHRSKAWGLHTARDNGSKKRRRDNMGRWMDRGPAEVASGSLVVLPRRERVSCSGGGWGACGGCDETHETQEYGTKKDGIQNDPVSHRNGEGTGAGNGNGNGAVVSQKKPGRLTADWGHSHAYPPRERTKKNHVFYISTSVEVKHLNCVRRWLCGLVNFGSDLGSNNDLQLSELIMSG